MKKYTNPEMKVELLNDIVDVVLDASSPTSPIEGPTIPTGEEPE